MPLHATLQGTPAGHFTFSGQGCSSSQVMTHTAPWQVPLVHTFLQSADVAGVPAVPGMPPLEPPPVALLPPVALPPAVALPPVAFEPPFEVPALVCAPPEPLSNKSF